MWRNRVRSYAFITFTDASAIDEALKLDKSEAEGRWLKVSIPREPSARPGSQPFSSEPSEDCKTLFVKNLPYEATEDQIGELFTQYGEVASVRIANENGRSKGFCFLDFEDAKSIKAVGEAAAKGMTWSLEGRDLFVDYGSGKPKAGFHPRQDSHNSRFSNKFAGNSIRKDRGGDRGFRGGDRGGDRGFRGGDRGYNNRDGGKRYNDRR
jgi:nucleolin